MPRFQHAAAINLAPLTTQRLAIITVHQNFRKGNRLRGGSEPNWNAEEEAYLEEKTKTEIKLISETQSWIRSQLEEILQQNPKPSNKAGLSDNIRKLYDHAEVQKLLENLADFGISECLPESQVLLEGEEAYQRNPDHPAWSNDGLLTMDMLRGIAELQVSLSISMAHFQRVAI